MATQKIAEKPGFLGLKVLVADDDASTRLLLRAAISQWGYHVVESADGEEAWKICAETDNPPRLLVLDWMMPKIDGVALSTRIKKDLPYHTYIILLTQITGTSNIVKALEAGADEFLTKPFNMAELHSRLFVGAKIIEYESILAEQNKELQKYAVEMGTMVDQRARELMQHTDFLMMLGSMVMRIAAELTDLFLQLNSEDISKQKQFIKIQQLQTNLKQIVEMIKQVQRDSMMTIHETQEADIKNIILKALTICATDLQDKEIKNNLEEKLPLVIVDINLIEKALVGLLLNSIELLKKQQNGTLEISTQLNPDKSRVQVIIECNGPAILIGNLSQVLYPLWGMQKKDDESLHLSVSMCREILQKFGGMLRIEPRNKGGLRFIVELPCRKEESVVP